MSEQSQDPFAVVADIEQLKTVEAVMDRLAQFAAQFGLASILLAGLPEEHFERAVLESRWPAEFLDLYTKNDYIKVDPLARFSRRSAMPFFWNETFYAGEGDPRALEVMGRAADFGMNEGLVVPIHRPRSIPAVVGLAGSSAELPPNGQTALHLVALYAFDRVRRLKPPPAPARSPLTERQREVLQWVMAGKTAWEIGEILNIAKRTVDNHVQNACSKLGAANRTQAVAVALRDGIIEP